MQSRTLQPFFSIVIPSLNEENFLPELLKDLSEQSYKNFEVIHVDADSDDTTVEKARSFSSSLNIKSIISKKRNVAHQRNIGASKAQGRWILFMDSDIRIPSYFLEGLKYNLTKNTAVDICTTLIDTESYSILNKPIIIFMNTLIEMLAHVKPIGPGAMICVKTAIARKYPFNTEVRLSEDHLFIEEVTENGHSFTCFKDPQYHTSLRRFEKNGSLVTIRNHVILYLKFIFSMESENDNKLYPMLGGTSYSKENISDLKALSKLHVLSNDAVIKLPKQLLKKIAKSISQKV